MRVAFAFVLIPGLRASCPLAGSLPNNRSNRGPTANLVLGGLIQLQKGIMAEGAGPESLAVQWFALGTEVILHSREILTSAL